MSAWEVGMNVVVEVKVEDDSAITRCVENHDEDGRPQPDERGGTGWRNTYYPLTSAEEVVEHFADNCIRNGIEDASRLDGWGDLATGAVTMRIKWTDPDWATA